MKRDMDLIRSLAMWLEGSDEWQQAKDFPHDLGLPDYSEQQLDEHLLLMQEAGLIDGIVTRMANGKPIWMALRLTWNGHEFLAAARDEAIWKQATSKVSSKVGTVTLDVLTRLLSDLAARALGLP